MLIVGSRIRIPLRELRFTFARSSGPGGQNVNKVSTKATLRWKIAASPNLPDEVRQRLLNAHRKSITSAGELIITSQRYRQLALNRADCLEKLRRMVADAAKPRPQRRPTKPTHASVRRRLADKAALAKKKQQRRFSQES